MKKTSLRGKSFLVASKSAGREQIMRDPDWTAEFVRDVHRARGVSVSCISAFFYLSNSPAVRFSCISMVRKLMYPRSTTFLITCSECLLGIFLLLPPRGFFFYGVSHDLSVRLDLLGLVLLFRWCDRLLLTPRY